MSKNRNAERQKKCQDEIKRYEDVLKEYQASMEKYKAVFGCNEGSSSAQHKYTGLASNEDAERQEKCQDEIKRDEDTVKEYQASMEKYKAVFGCNEGSSSAQHEYTDAALNKLDDTKLQASDKVINVEHKAWTEVIKEKLNAFCIKMEFIHDLISPQTTLLNLVHNIRTALPPEVLPEICSSNEPGSLHWHITLGPIFKNHAILTQKDLKRFLDICNAITTLCLTGDLPKLVENLKNTIPPEVLSLICSYPESISIFYKISDSQRGWERNIERLQGTFFFMLPIFIAFSMIILFKQFQIWESQRRQRPVVSPPPSRPQAAAPVVFSAPPSADQNAPLTEEIPDLLEQQDALRPTRV